jgi:hypothetical protein
VKFFSNKGTAVGDRRSLESLLCTITGIPAQALRGIPLSHLPVVERIAWAERRYTTRPKDKAYSLLGIFKVLMSLIYGEGEDRGMKRLRKTIAEDQKGEPMRCIISLPNY